MDFKADYNLPLAGFAMDAIFTHSLTTIFLRVR